VEVVKIGVIKKRYITLAINLILIVSVLSGMFSRSELLSNSANYSNEIINNLLFNQIKNTPISKNLKNIDGFFTENQGQVDNESVRYYIQGKGVWFFDDGVVFEIREEIENINQGALDLFDPLSRLNPKEPPKYKSVFIKLNFEGVNRIVPEGRGLLSHRSNFFYGNDSVKWCTNMPNYQEIIYKNIYDNIDLRYYIITKGLKYDFIVHPGGNPNNIKLKYYGVQKVFIDKFKNLKIKTSLGDMINSNLFIYQNVKNDKKVINGKFRILNATTYGFEIDDKYNRNIDLIIDPLIYSTFVGGIGDEFGLGIALDTLGCIYVTGWTNSLDFPNTTNVYNTINKGELDVFVLKLNPMGSSLLYSTFIGGNDWDYGFDIVIDSRPRIDWISIGTYRVQARYSDIYSNIIEFEIK